jgi:serine/threonine-protein kinase SRPK3
MPERWWSLWGSRRNWFEEDGTPRAPRSETSEGGSIRERLRDIGIDELDDPSNMGPMLEKAGTLLEEREMDLLGDLLEKMLQWRPEDRIMMGEVVRHPWFSYC